MKKLILFLFISIHSLYGFYALNPETGKCAETDKTFSETSSYLFQNGIICSLSASNSKLQASECKGRDGEKFVLLFTVELETCEQIAKELKE
jgi:hypothetical protein